MGKTYSMCGSGPKAPSEMGSQYLPTVQETQRFLMSHKRSPPCPRTPLSPATPPTPAWGSLNGPVIQLNLLAAQMGHHSLIPQQQLWLKKPFEKQNKMQFRLENTK